MTISSVTSKVIYVGDGATKIFAYPFKILEDTDLTVTEYYTATGSTNSLTLNTDYAVSGVGVAGGGNVTLTGSYTSLATGSQLVIEREMDLTQETDYVENDPFSAETHEQALDKLTMIAQQLKALMDRSLLRDITQTSSLTFPTAEADNYIGWNAGATGLENKTPATLDFISVDTDITLGTANASDVKVPTQKATKTYVDDQIGDDGEGNPTNLLTNGDFESWSAGFAVAPDGWVLIGVGATVSRNPVTVKMGTYSARVQRSTNDLDFRQAVEDERGIAYWQGKYASIGCWAWADSSSRVRVGIYDGVSTTYSDYHTGAGSWEFLTTTRAIDASATVLWADCRITGGDTYAFFDGCILVEGRTSFAFARRPIADPELVTGSALVLRTTGYLKITHLGSAYKLALIT